VGTPYNSGEVARATKAFPTVPGITPIGNFSNQTGLTSTIWQRLGI